MALSRLLIGAAADGSVRVWGPQPGHAYRLLSPSNAVLAQGVAVADSNGDGVATLAGATLPQAAHVQGYTDGTYSTPIAGQRWPAAGDASINNGNIFEADLSRLGLYGVELVGGDAGPNFSYYYPTSQFGGSTNQLIDSNPANPNAGYLFAIGRVGGSFEDGGGSLVAYRKNKATGVWDQGPVTLQGNPDGHESFIIRRAPDGRIRFVGGGGYFGVSLQYRETINPDDISSWSAPVTIGTPVSPSFIVYRILSDGTNLVAYSGGFNAGGGLYFGEAASGSTAFAWRQIASNANGFCAFAVDLAVYQAPGVEKVGLLWGNFGVALHYDVAYRKIYYAESANRFQGGVAQKASGAAFGIPLTFDTNGYCPNADLVIDGYHLGPWVKLAYPAGVPTLIEDGDRSIVGDPCHFMRWTGSAWASVSINEVLSNDAGSGGGSIQDRLYNQGLALDVDSEGKLHLWATRIPNPIAAYNGTDWTQGSELVHAVSNDGGQTYSVEVVLSGAAYEPFSYAGLKRGVHGPNGVVWSNGLVYPKSVLGYPRRVMFGASDTDTSTLLMVHTSAPTPVGRSWSLPYNVGGTVGRSWSLPYNNAGPLPTEWPTRRRLLERALPTEWPTRRRLLPGNTLWPTRRRVSPGAAFRTRRLIVPLAQPPVPFPSRWTFVVCDRAGNELGELRNARERRLRFPLRRTPTLAFNIKADNPMARHLRAGAAIVKAYEDSTGVPVLRLVAEVASRQKVISGARGTIAVTCAGLQWRFARRLIGKAIGGTTLETSAVPDPITGLGGLKERGLLAALILDALNAGDGSVVKCDAGDTGIRRGAIAATAAMYVGPWIYKPAEEAFAELAAGLDGFDWEVAPVEPTPDALGVQMGLLNIAPQLGSVLPDVVWEAGAGRRNVKEWSEIEDAATLMNDGHQLPAGWPTTTTSPVFELTDPASIATYGRQEGIVTGELQTDPLREQLLRDHLRVRATPRQVLTFTPMPQLDPDAGEARRVPRLFADYNVGDVMPFRATERVQVTDPTLDLVTAYAHERTVDALFRLFVAEVTISDNDVASVALTIAEDGA